jgi:hypothetical protein
MQGNLNLERKSILFVVGERLDCDRSTPLQNWRFNYALAVTPRPASLPGAFVRWRAVTDGDWAGGTTKRAAEMDLHY